METPSSRGSPGAWKVAEVSIVSSADGAPPSRARGTA
jgi:hypothetical protein